MIYFFKSHLIRIRLYFASVRVMASHGVNMGFNFGWKLVLLSSIWILSVVVDARLDRLYTGIFWCYIGTQDSLERQVFMQ